MPVSARDALRQLGQVNLADSIRILTGEELWNKQDEIATAMSAPGAQVVVPSCFASGKTWLAARIALAFYDAFTPGVHCDICNGPCGGAKVITTSTKEEHLVDNLWGEIRMAWPKLMDRHGFEGRLWPAETRIESAGNHFITGLVATRPEGFQGYHAAHVLVVADEATALSPEVAAGISGLLASGDARLLLILNPTDGTTYAAAKARSPRTTTIKITAFDTPNFTKEHVPEGAHLITKEYLDDLVLEGSGPGSYEWTTRVLAEFWNLTDDTLIADGWYEDARTGLLIPGGSRSVGIDIASYGSAESVIALRDGLALAEVRPFNAGRVDHFFEGPVVQAILDFDPHFVVYDADGVGAGAIGYAEKLYKHLLPGAQVIPFRGAKKINDHYTNARSAWYWALRKHFESKNITIMFNDHKLKEQALGIRYSISNGAIRVETKEEMKKRGMASPDRLDAMMYAFAYAVDLPIPVARPLESAVDKLYGVSDRSDEAMWKRQSERQQAIEHDVHPILGSDW